MGRLVLLLALIGAAMVHWLPALPQWPALLPLATGSGLLYGLVARSQSHLTRWRLLTALAVILCALLLGAGYTVWRADLRLADSLDVRHENVVTRLHIEVTGLDAGDGTYRRFPARVLQSPVTGVPERLWVGWHAAAPEAPVPEVRPGDVWSAALILRRPHGARNPQAFDAEAWMFERGLRARARVRGEPWRVAAETRPDWHVRLQAARHDLRAALRRSLDGTRWGAVIIALALGDQASVAAADWEVFSRTGIIHLVSISGLHITLLAGVAGLAGSWLWRRGRWRAVPLAERVPAQVMGAAVALVVAWLYCLLAGWGVPAQRTFFMLATVALAAMIRLPIDASRLLLVAATAVMVLDPWAALAPGFWLSFGAVAVLMQMAAGRWQPGAPRGWRQQVCQAAVLQLTITLALMPLLAWQFHEVSLASLPANALAIAVVSFIVTPLALAGMLLSPLPLLGVAGGWLALLAEQVFGWLMWPILWLSQQTWASWPVAAPPGWLVLLALGGVAWALMPAGLPWRHAGWMLLLPLFWQVPARPDYGEWRLTALDVGQGSAVLVETRHHVLVFDTGPPFGPHTDAGERVVWPALRARGWRRVTDLVVSHHDADHAGGMASLLRRLPADRLWSAMGVPAGVARPADLPFAPCQAGQGWQRDGVVFRFVHPASSMAMDSPARDGDPVTPGPQPRAGNEASCVLHLQGWWHAALLTGDVGKAQERWMVRQAPTPLPRAQVVLMPHHGSRTSSGAPFVAESGARHAVAQAAWLSRFGHPHAEVVSRWHAAGVSVHNTADTGALVATSDAHGLQLEATRSLARRYWSHPEPSERRPVRDD